VVKRKLKKKKKTTNTNRQNTHGHCLHTHKRSNILKQHWQINGLSDTKQRVNLTLGNSCTKNRKERKKKNRKTETKITQINLKSKS